MSLKGREISISKISTFSQWQDIFLENLIKQQRLKNRHLYTSTMTVKDIFNLATINFNLGRFDLSILQLSMIVKLDSSPEKITALIGMGKMSLSSAKFKFAYTFFGFAIYLMKNESKINVETYNYCLKQCKYIENKCRELNINLSNDLSSKDNNNSIANNSKFFQNFQVFEIKINIFSFYLYNFQNDAELNCDYVKNIVNYWNMYEETSSILLSGIVSKGTSDLEKALNNTFLFIADFPLKLLTKKLLSYSSLETIIDENLGKYNNFIFSEEPTIEEIIYQSEKFHKKGTYLKYLLVYLESKIIINAKKFVLTEADKTFLIYELEMIARICLLLIEFFNSNFNDNILNKKLFEKRKKIIQFYKNEIEYFVNQIIKIGIVAMVYIFLDYKEDKELSNYCSIKSIRLLKLKMIKKSVVQLRKFTILFNSRKLELKNKNIIKKAMILGDEILAHLDIEEILPNLIDNKSQNFRRLNSFFTERLLSGYIQLLELNASDDPNNSKIIKHLMYYVLLQGGYHISVIWFLNILYEYSKIRNAISIINEGDGIDDFEYSMIGHNLDQYKEQLNFIIKKIIMSQQTNEILRFKSQNEKGEDIEIEKKQIKILREGHHLVLPQVIFNSSDEIIFLPEFCSFIQNGNTIRMNLLNVKLENGKKSKNLIDCQNKIDSDSLIQLKSILKPTKEFIYECIKKSNILIETILNSNKIAFVNELKKRKRCRDLIQQACGDIAIPFISEDMCNEVYNQISKEEKSDYNVQQQELRENIQSFRKKVPNSESNEKTGEDVWHSILECGAAGYVANIVEK